MLCNGEFLHKDPEEAIDYLNELVEKAHTWTGPSATNSTSRSRSSGIYHLKEEDNLKAQLEVATRELEILKMKNNRVIHTVAKRGKIPSQPQTNPKNLHLVQESTSSSENTKGVNAITTCTGKVIEPLQKAPKLKDPTPSHEDDLLEEPEKEVSAVIEQRTPPKYKDLRCPTIACQIGSQEFSEALLDLGASVNLMPYSIYLQLGLGKIKPTSMVLQLADCSCRKPRGIVEDVLLQIDKFYYPVDFLVLDTQSKINSESKIPLILGRSFLATANALINCRNGLMKLSFGNMTLEVNIFHVGKQLHDDDECYQTYMIDSLVEEVYEREHIESLEYLLGDYDLDVDFLNYPINDQSNVSSISNVLQDRHRKFLQPHFEELTPDASVLCNTAQGLEPETGCQTPDAIGNPFALVTATSRTLLTLLLMKNGEISLEPSKFQIYP
ncbi:hypothetical protein SLEP1_g23281 [Rubroshorea leprosula]|uniref:Uncharacterized protein n=1 Tax=Rubroshorea leprosula TaxID=152421 RepID=A0AAV5JH56_9ROSI|nr:hypothetical protein SLEP1_g23281 [Rubroshorea leprosula]